MADSIRMKTITGPDSVEVRALINHPMDVGKWDKTTEKFVGPHYIEKVVIELNGKTIVQGDWSTGVAKNPYLGFRVRGARTGDKLKLSWKDNQGGSDFLETVVT